MLRKLEFPKRLAAWFALSVCIVFAGLFLLHNVAAQVTGSGNGKPAPAADANLANRYRLGPGDVLDIRIYNRPLLSREAVRIDERGMIRLPLINEVLAECRTESELADAIGKTYLEYLKNPYVEVFIKEYNSQPVVVLGAVKSPGRFQLQRRVHLVEMVSLAGGLTDLADGKIQVMHASGRRGCEPTAAGGYQPSPVAQNDDSVAVEWYDLSELMKREKSGGELPIAQAGDTINLLEANKAFIIGNVLKPMEIPLKDEVTLSQAIAMAGGAMPASRLEKIKIIRQPAAGGPKGEMIVDLKAINRQQEQDVVIQANDIIEVPTSSGKKFVQSLVDGVLPSLARMPIRVIN